mgnify:CR=1 FL=1
MREWPREVRGRNSFFGLIVILLVGGWIGLRSSSQKTSTSVTSAVTLKVKNQHATSDAEEFGELDLERDYRLRLSNSYRFSTILTFNQPVSSERASGFFEFRSAENVLIPAKVEAVDSDIHKLRIVPEQLLEGGVEWKLILKAGLQSVDSKFQFPKDREWDLGERNVMRVDGAYADNQLNAGRSIRVDFSHPLPSDLNPEDFAEWLVLERKDKEGYVPANVNLSIQIRWRGLTLSGSFALNTPYRVKIKSGLPARLGLRLKDQWEQLFRFNPLSGRVYLADTTTSQSLFGNRSFEFVSVNNRSVRLQVKRVDPDQVFRVLQTYYREYLGRSAFKWSGNSWKQRISQPISYELVPGQEVISKVYPVRAKTDEALKREFRWGELLEENVSGTLFVNVESMGVDGSANTAQSIVQLTDIGLVWKESKEDIFFHTFSLKSASPLEKTRIRILSESGKNVALSHTDATGNVMLKARRTGEPLWVQVSKEDDQHIYQLDSGFASIPMWSYGVDTWRPWQNDKKLHLFTDRSIYQPGETVYLKGHVRSWHDGELGVPESSDYDVQVSGPQRRVYHQQKIKPDSSGAFDLEIKLPVGVHGSFEIQVGSGSVFVDALEYEPATFKVKSESAGIFGPTESVKIPISASYYFGKPISGAKLKWSLNACSEKPRFPQWEEYDFGMIQESAQNIYSGEMTLDSKGRTVVEPELPDLKNGLMKGNLSVHVTDVSGQAVTEYFSITQYSSDYYLGVRGLSSVQRIGQPLKLKVVAVGVDGKAYSDNVQVKAFLKRVEWHSVKIKGAGGGVAFQNKRRFIPVGTTSFKTVGLEDDAIETVLRSMQAGEYRLEVVSQDAGGREVSTQVDFYVSGKGSLAWDYSNEFKMGLVPDQKVYNTGETAKILLKAPFKGRALVTVERERVLRTFQVDVEGNAPMIELALDSLDVPNVFVSVLLLRGADESTRQIKSIEYRMGYCELMVEASDSRLEVLAELQSTSVQPGEEVGVSVNVSTTDGVAVANSEVTLFAVDEGVLDLTGYRAPDLHSFFYEPKVLDVRTSSTIPFMRTEDPGRVRFANKGHIIGGGGSEVMRQNFQAVAFWAATLHTDNSGNVRARFVAPDNLTRYRIFAIACTDRQFGVGEAGFRVHLPLMIESALPRFGRVGDELVAKAMVHNQTDTHRTVIVSLKTDDYIQALSQTSPSLTLAPQSTIAVNVPIRFAHVGRSRSEWELREQGVNVVRDSRESWIDIRHVAPLRKAVYFVRANGNIPDLLKQLDSDIRNGEGELEVSVSNSSMAEMGPASEYLLDYPHGCAEQTSSRLLPWLLLEEHRDILPLLNQSQNLKKSNPVEHGVNRLLSMQTHNGGLSYWPNGVADGFASSYGGMVLVLAKRKGKRVPQVALDRLGEYLVRLVKRPVNEDYDWGVHCLALYTLALMDKSMPAYHEQAFTQRRQLAPDAVSLLAAAVKETGGSSEMLNDLLKAKANGIWAFGYYGNKNQQIAMRLLAESDGPNAVKLAGQLSQAAQQGHWGSTFANAWVILAMTSYDQRDSRAGTINGIIEFAGEERKILLDSSQRMVVFRTKNQPGAMKLRHNGREGQVLFVRVSAFTRSEVDRTNSVSKGMTLERSYKVILPDGNISSRHKEPQVGDLVRVKMKINVLMDEVRYLALEDGLPSSLEPVFGNLKSQQSSIEMRNSWFIDHYELRKDRAVFYANYLSKGVHYFEYLARVRAEGIVSIPQAKVEAMYNSDIVALSSGGSMVTRSIND